MNKVFTFLIVIILCAVFSLPSSAGLSLEKKQEIKALYSANNLDEAYAQITKIIEDERDFELWYILANISQDKGNNTNAVFFLQKSINLNPAFDKAHYNLGNIYLSEKRYNMAIKEYKETLKYKKEKRVKLKQI